MESPAWDRACGLLWVDQVIGAEPSQMVFDGGDSDVVDLPQSGDLGKRCELSESDIDPRRDDAPQSSGFGPDGMLLDHRKE